MYERSRRTGLTFFQTMDNLFQFKENVSPQVQSTSPSNCMVVRGGTIPASLQPFPGMEHDRTLLNELSQETSSNGFSQFVETPREFDDDKEIEVSSKQKHFSL